MSRCRDFVGPGLLLLLAVLLSCGDSEPPTGPENGDARVHGTLASAKTGDGVANAIVVLRRDSTVVATTATDADGRFAFSGVADGEYTARLTGLELTDLRLRSTAFEPREQTVAVAGEPVELFFSAVGLIPARVVGYVRCDGSPVEGADVRVVGGDTDRTVATNAQGKYGVTDLAAGHYAVIPVEAPCTPRPEYHAVEVRRGQLVQVDFEG